jgi:transcriptional regulator with XRE-family HTH domain
MGRKSKEHKDAELEALAGNLAANVKTCRGARKLSQLQLAAMAGVSITTISEIENGKAENVRLKTITSLARQLNVDSLYLLKKKSI